ncbi:MAG: dihydroxy-acid dehydratase, partial [Rhizobiaceae bacterium]
GHVARAPAPTSSGDDKVLVPVSRPFQPTGGLKVLSGNLGRAVIKTSAIKADRHVIEAPALVFENQEALQQAFRDGRLAGDFVAVIRFQGPRANGMPELHKLTPVLGVLQDRGQRVALVTDGRMSGASGKVPAAIHVTPEALDGGQIGKIRNGDIIRLDATAGQLDVLVGEALLAARQAAEADLSGNAHGTGRELFSAFRKLVGRADEGAAVAV